MSNMEIYEKVRVVPETAKKPIAAGKLKGFTDINPMWRIKALTEVFGPAGIGWYYTIDRQWLEPGTDGKVAAFCNISLYVKPADSENWSMPIVGTGGSGFVNIFKGNPETSDEAYKMALTDAISVACKALGMGADVYWNESRTKYDQASDGASKTARNSARSTNTQAKKNLCDDKEKRVVYALCGGKEKLIEMMKQYGPGENWDTMTAETAAKIKKAIGDEKKNES